MNILVTDAATVTSGDIDLSVLERLGSLTVRQRTAPEELIPLLADCDILLCNKTVMGKTELDAAPNLKYIGLFATGYNNIDTEYARERGVTVCNAGSYSTDAVAQHTFALILSFFSRVVSTAHLCQAADGSAVRPSPPLSAHITSFTVRLSVLSATAVSARRWQRSQMPSV